MNIITITITIYTGEEVKLRYENKVIFTEVWTTMTYMSWFHLEKKIYIYIAG